MAIAFTCLATAASPDQFTEAENLLFVSPHLVGLEAGATLHYQAHRGGSLQPAYDDSAVLTLNQENDSLTPKLSYLTGQRKLELPPFPDMQGNPVLLHFLEREIREMSRLTGGSVNYYRKRIRMALATTPQVSKVNIQYGNKTLQARQVRIAPYLNDPARGRYEKFAPRSYEFILSPKVPGGIFKLSASLYANGKTGDPNNLLWSETLELTNNANQK